jgi:hypothetical protein
MQPLLSAISTFQAIDSRDARFVLVTRSAFANYLVALASAGATARASN